MVPLRHELQNGDTIEIITSANQRPNRDWLQFVKTSKARNKIRQWLKAVEREQSISLGKELLERELRKNGTSLAKLMKDGDELKRVASDLSLHRVDDLLEAVGHGKLSPGQVSGRVMKILFPATEEDTTPLEAEVRPPKEAGPIRIKGMQDLLVRLASCCQPIPGDQIVGYITRGKGVTIHRSDCAYLARTEGFRQFPAEWDGHPADLYAANIQVVTVDKPGLLADITNALKSADVNVTKASVTTTDENRGIANFTVQVSDQQHLDRVFAALKKLKEVISVRRVKT
jgi:guanosine-3',5'-bis(diphosphate) 3'-pyrophosphohydrolase